VITRQMPALLRRHCGGGAEGLDWPEALRQSDFNQAYRGRRFGG